ncbi:MAG: hypothetical protein FJY80_06975 [Candidatus Aminicenantes bacterium]|nr:hypothetical protein [Candidatus Aminicenantes bacterium]
MQPAGMTRLERESRSRLKPIVSREEFLHATPTLRQVSCGRPNCKCQRGEKHSALVLTRRSHGKLEQLHVPKDLEPLARALVDRYHEIQDLLDQIAAASWDRLKKKKR